MPTWASERTGIAFLVPAHAHAAAAGPADVAGGKRDVHQRGIGAVVVVAPDEALLVAEHGAAALAVLWFGDPGGGLDDVLGLEAGDLAPPPSSDGLVGGQRPCRSHWSTRR